MKRQDEPWRALMLCSIIVMNYTITLTKRRRNSTADVDWRGPVDGITNGAIYALLGLALVLVFAVTRVILIPQGEFITFGALTYASLSAGQIPGTIKLAVAMGIVAFAFDMFTFRKSLHAKRVLRAFAVNIVFPLAIWGMMLALAGRPANIAANIALSLLIVAAI
eukprot:gene3820-5225_t